MLYFFAVDNPELMAGVTSLSRLLNLPHHPDHFVLLQVIFPLNLGGPSFWT